MCKKARSSKFQNVGKVTKRFFQPFSMIYSTVQHMVPSLVHVASTITISYCREGRDECGQRCDGEDSQLCSELRYILYHSTY
jgi:hypothetical protein